MNNDTPLSSSLLAVPENMQKRELPLSFTKEPQCSFSGEVFKEIDYILQLHRLGRLLCTLTEGHLAFFCREVEEITHGCATLHLNTQASLPPDIFSMLLLQFNDRHYGYLAIRCDETHHQPAISLFTAHMMAQAISCILHMLDHHLFLRSFGSADYRVETVTLTMQEQSVLSLLCQNQTREEIAETLSVSLPTVNTHLRHIYEKLTVHNEYDARILAFNTGLFSFLSTARH